MDEPAGVAALLSAKDAKEPGVGVAVSGGGHRAALFALGTLMYLADSGRNQDVSSISSVSGGSMTNGVVARSMDFRTVDGPTFQQLMTPLASRLATKGTFQGQTLTGAQKLWFLVPLALLAVFAIFSLDPLYRYGIYMGAVTVWSLALIPPLFGTTLARVYGVVLVVSLVAALVTSWAVPISSGGLTGAPGALVEWLAAPVGRFALFLLSIVAWGWVASLRGKVCAAAFRETLFPADTGRIPLLRDINAEGIDHVFCATDLQSAEQVYFGKDFIYGYRFGKGDPANLPLHEAVQASANLPFAFPVRRIPTRGHNLRYLDPMGECPEPEDRPVPYPPKHLVLTDGGVYDNMADQWPQGFAGRAKRCWPTLRQEHHEPNVLIVANASGGLGWQTIGRSRIPLFGEVAALLQIKSVLYDQTTAQRRSGLVARFARAEFENRGLRGALVNIPQTPYTVADEYKKRAEGPWKDRARRARAVIALIGDEDQQREAWKRTAKENAEIPTVLSAIGAEVSARLLRHAYILAMANCHVILGYPLPRTLPPPQRFDNMVRGILEDPPSWTFEAAKDDSASVPLGPADRPEPS